MARVLNTVNYAVARLWIKCTRFVGYFRILLYIKVCLLRKLTGSKGKGDSKIVP